MGVEPLFITNYEAAQSKNFPYGEIKKTQTTGTNGSVHHKFEGYEWKVSGRVLFAFDEAQACRSLKTINSTMLISAARRFKTCMLTATPFTHPGEAGPIGTTLRLFPQSKFWNWKLRHGMRKNPFGHLEFCGGQKSARSRAEGLEYMAAIHREIFPDRGVRTTRAEIPGFPDEITTVQAVEAQDPGAVEQAYHDLIAISRSEDYLRALVDVPEDLHDWVAPLPITMALRARQTAELQKCAGIVELAKEARERGESVAIFVNFDHTIEALCEMLDTHCVVRGKPARGGNNYDRAHAVTEFQANRQPYIIVNCQAGGAGVNLHDPVTQKPRTSLISPPWSALVLKQVLGRTLRLGGGFSTRRLLFTAGTIEERVMQRVRTMTDNLDMLTDGDLNVIR